MCESTQVWSRGRMRHSGATCFLSEELNRAGVIWIETSTLFSMEESQIAFRKFVRHHDPSMTSRVRSTDEGLRASSKAFANFSTAFSAAKFRRLRISDLYTAHISQAIYLPLHCANRRAANSLLVE